MKRKYRIGAAVLVGLLISALLMSILWNGTMGKKLFRAVLSGFIFPGITEISRQKIATESSFIPDSAECDSMKYPEQEREASSTMPPGPAKTEESSEQKEAGEEWISEADKKSVMEIASQFRRTSDTVHYERTDDIYRKSLLYFFSSGTDGEETVDQWIAEIKEHHIVSAARFIPDASSIRRNEQHYTVVKGLFQICYDRDTSPLFLQKKEMQAGCWYEREEELLFYIAVDDQKWDRAEYVFYKGKELCGFREVKL